MAKRAGRPPLDPKKRKGIQISVRLKADTVQSLNEAAQGHGVSLATEITNRLEDSLGHIAEEPELFGGRKTYSVALLLALSLKHLRTLTGHWWHEDPFTFQHAKAAAEIVLEYCKPPGKPVVPDDLPPPLPGQVRRASVGLPIRRVRFGEEAALELIAAVEAFSGTYGEQYGRLAHQLPEKEREAHLRNLGIYRRLGRGLLHLHNRKIMRKRASSDRSKSPRRGKTMARPKYDKT